MNEAEFLEEHTPESKEQEKEVENKQEEIQEEIKEVPELSATDQKAFDQGWRPEEEFDGPKENWKTAKEYIKDGEWISKVNELNRKIDSQEASFNERLENTNKLNEARRQTELKALKKQQRDAVEQADSDTYDAAQEKIDDLEKQPEATTTKPVMDPTIAAWEEKNPWINEAGNEKADVAKSIYNTYLQQNPNSTYAQALSHVDDRVNKLYPTNNENPRRNQPNTSETNQRKPRNNKELTMNDLTQDEQAEWNQYGKMMFKTPDKFLKAVADARKA